MRVLVCGSRDWNDDVVIEQILSGLSNYDDLVVIEGEARGADCAAARWAQDGGVDLERYPADWKPTARLLVPSVISRCSPRVSLMLSGLSLMTLGTPRARPTW